MRRSVATSKTKPPIHIAEVVDPRTGDRRRVRHRSKRAAADQSRRSKTREADLFAVLGNRTVAQACRQLRERLMLEDKTEVAAAVDRVIRLHLDETIGRFQLRRLTVLDLCAFRDRLRADPKVSRRQAWTVMGYVCRALRHAFGSLQPPVRYARELPGWGDRAAYGAKGLAHANRSVPYGKESDRRIAAAVGQLRILLILLIHLGLRIGEALAIRVCDIEFDGDQGLSWLSVRGTQSRGGSRGSTKTKRGQRTIPLTPVAEREIRKWMADTGAGAGSERQLVAEDDEKVLRYSTAYRRHTHLQRRLGGPRFTFHDYRAGWVTTALIGGMSISALTLWVGHKHFSMTLKHYVGAVLLAEALWRLIHPAGGPTKSPLARIGEETGGRSGVALAGSVTVGSASMAVTASASRSVAPPARRAAVAGHSDVR